MVALHRVDPSVAEPALRECLEIRQRVFPEGHRRTALASSALGEALTKLGRFQEAEPLLRGSLPVLQAIGGNQHGETRKAVNRIVELYEAWDRPEQAAVYRARATTIESGERSDSKER